MKIEKLPSGNYSARISLRDPDGKRHTKRFTAKTKREVLNAAAEYQSAITVYMESNAFSDSLTRFLDESEQILSPSTMRGYMTIKRTLEQYSAFYHTPLDRITRQQLQALVDDLSRTRKPKTVRNILGLISAVMQANGYRMPPVKSKKVEVYPAHVPDPETVRKVSAAAKGTRWEIPFALACMGLRRGEICAVTADDLIENTLHIHHALAMDQHNGIVEKGPKTSGSDRYVVIPDAIADLIRQNGRAWNASLNALTNGFPHLLDRAGVEHFRLHDCRHFFASYCHDILHLSDAQIMKLGGWSTDHVMKRIYITALSDKSKLVSNALGALF